MAFGKSSEEKARIAEQKEAAQFAASPLGRAQLAKEAGAGFFQVELEISKIGGGYGRGSAFGSSGNSVRHTGGRPDMLGQIEELGWHLEHVGYVFVETGSTSSNRIGGTGQGVVTRGEVLGIYLFRSR